jgi:DNA-binding PadR family transcriptional regulator
MAILAMLTDESMHAYRMHELIKDRGKAGVVNVAQRNSVYQTIERLLRADLIRVEKTMRAEGRPERVVYAITATGSAALKQWLKEMLAVPAAEFPQFPAALSFVMVLPQQEARAQLELRVAALEAHLHQAVATLQAIRATALPRLFLIEEEYKQALLESELTWIRSLLDDMRTGEITWNAKVVASGCGHLRQP